MRTTLKGWRNGFSNNQGSCSRPFRHPFRVDFDTGCPDPGLKTRAGFQRPFRAATSPEIGISDVPTASEDPGWITTPLQGDLGELCAGSDLSEHPRCPMVLATTINTFL